MNGGIDMTLTACVPKRAVHRVCPAASAHACSFSTVFAPIARAGRLIMRARATSSLSVASSRRYASRSLTSVRSQNGVPASITHSMPSRLCARGERSAGFVKVIDWLAISLRAATIAFCLQSYFHAASWRHPPPAGLLTH